MLTLQKAFSQLRLVVGTTAEHAARCSQNMAATHLLSPNPAPPSLNVLCAQSYSTKPGSHKDEGQAEGRSFDPPSPYRNPGPRRYGYQPNFFTGGPLPRHKDEGPIKSLPKYKVKDKWSRKRALFGQNDFIDILGDGSIRPIDLLHGPRWLVGFKGNELQRLSRRLRFEEPKLKLLYPTEYHNIKKRIDFLYKKYNVKRGKRVGNR